MFLASAAPGSMGEFLHVLFILALIPALIIAAVMLAPWAIPKIRELLNPPPAPLTVDDFAEQVADHYYSLTGFDKTRTEVMDFARRVFAYERSNYPERVAESLRLLYVNTPPKFETAFSAPLSETSGTNDVLQSFLDCYRGFERISRQVAANQPKKPDGDVLPLLHGTPLYEAAARFSSQEVPIQIPDSLRFRHQFVVGASGSGKTTFLSAQINADLDRVARGEASVFVMDSSNELVPNIAHLERFSPRGDLAGKLVYLEPDPDFPLALNIFDFDRARYKNLSGKERVTLTRGVEEMIVFFIKSVVRADTSGFMESIIKPVLRATMLVPDATILVFRDFLQKGGFAKHEAHLAELSENDRRFLTADMFDSGYTMSLSAMRTRMASFTNDELFSSMFAQPRNRLDLLHLLSEPRVILVNTMEGMFKGSIEPFGRFFIAKLLHATEERMFLSKDERLPVFAYIDEAQDYLKHEENIRELVEKARKQNVALTIATHSPEDFDASIRGALEKTAIQARGQNAPYWQVSLSGAAPLTVKVPPIDFATMQRMSTRHFGIVQAVMRKHFSVTLPTPAAPASSSPPNLVKLRPDEDPPTGDWSR